MSEIKEKVNELWDFIEKHITEKDEYPKKLYDYLEDFIDLEKELEQTITEYGNLTIQYLKLEKENNKLLIENERLDKRVCTLEELVNINRKINELATKTVNENEKLKQKLDYINSFSYSMPPYYRDIIKEVLGNE